MFLPFLYGSDDDGKRGRLLCAGNANSLDLERSCSRFGRLRVLSTSSVYVRSGVTAVMSRSPRLATYSGRS